MIGKAPFTLAACLALGGCVAGPPPEIATPAPVLPEAFLYQPSARDDAAMAGLLPHHDPAFEALLERALDDAPSLAEALARVEAARAAARGAGAARLPGIGTDASVAATRTNPAQFGADLPSGIAFETDQTAYSANLTAAWEIDLFGRLKASERAALARLDAADASAQTVRNALIAELAGTLIDWRTLEARRGAVQQDLAASERLVDLTAERQRAGLLPGFNQVRTEANASQSRTRLAALESERARLIGRFVTLTGLPTGSVTALLERVSDEHGISATPAAMPSSLLRNRPDVRAAEAELVAADAGLAAAARQRFPRLTLSAALGLLAFDLGKLFDDGSDVYTLRGGIAAPLFDFGRIQSEIDRAAADKRAAFAAYRGAVFAALGEAETAYGLVAAADLEAAAASEENAKLERVAELAETRFTAGLEDSLTLFEARRTADTSGERAAAAFGRAQRARVLLWLALGGDAHATTRSTSQ